MRRFMSMPAIVLALSATSVPAFAHSFPKSSVPAAGSTVAQPPAEVTITFTEPLEPRFSRIEVFDQASHRVDTGDTQAAPGDARALHVGLKPLAAGAYKVVWHATSVDTHKTEGSFKFTVAP